MQNHSQHYSISSCAYSGVDNSRKFLSSRSFRIGIWKISINADFTYFHDFVHACNHGTLFFHGLFKVAIHLFDDFLFFNVYKIKGAPSTSKCF